MRRAAVLCALFLVSACSTPPPRFTNALGVQLAFIPAGEFDMGAPRAYAMAMAEQVTADWSRTDAAWPSMATPARRIATAAMGSAS